MFLTLNFAAPLWEKHKSWVLALFNFCVFSQDERSGEQNQKTKTQLLNSKHHKFTYLHYDTSSLLFTEYILIFEFQFLKVLLFTFDI